MYVYRSNFVTYPDYELTMILQKTWHIIYNAVQEMIYAKFQKYSEELCFHLLQNGEVIKDITIY
jgi:hypothetical protein